MNKIFQRFFLFEKYEIKTKLPKQQILDRIKSFADPEYTDYYGSIWEDGFFIGEKNRKHFAGGFSQNSLAPVAKAKIFEKDGFTTVSMILRPHLLVLILFVPFYVISLLTVVMFPLVWLFLYFAFIKPTTRLRQAIESLLIENEV